MTDPDSYQYPVFAPAYGSSKSAVNMLTVGQGPVTDTVQQARRRELVR
jgi:hypothetical protein